MTIDSRDELRDFLTTRRARVTPQKAGLPAYGGDNRRVPGLRREEVAMLAGVSVDYYTRLERGNARGVSEQVLDSLARALQLTEAEQTHLFDLARATNAAIRPTRRPARPQVRPSIRHVLDAMTAAPAYVRNGRLDVLAANSLGRAVFQPLFDSPARPTNLARFIFLDPAAREFYQDWDSIAADNVALLRAEAGRSPHDKILCELIGELSTRSETFRTWWAHHNVRNHRSGVKHLHHPLVGDLTLAYEALELASEPGLRLNAYTAEPGTPAQDALSLLASWTAAPVAVPTADPEPAATGHDAQSGGARTTTGRLGAADN
jgi:transcriptional regulator with XRE-family HTH domain